MEYERSLFRIYDLALSQPRFIKFIKAFAVIFASFGLFHMVLFGIFHVNYIDQGDILAEAFSTQLLSGCGIYQRSQFNLSLPLDDSCRYIENTTTLLPEDIYNITVNDIKYQFSIESQSLFFDDEILLRKNYTYHDLNLDNLIPDGLFFLAKISQEIDTIVINQLKTVFVTGGMLKNLETKEIWIWSKFYAKHKENLSFGWRVYNLVKAIFWFFCVSLITALTCRFAIIGSSAMLLLFVSLPCVSRIHPECSEIALLSFPWIGEPAYALSRSGKSTFKLIISFLQTLFVLYLMYICTSIAWTFFLFENIYPQYIDEKFYNLMSFIEFFALLFVRTKRSVAYYPRFIAGFLISFLLYRYNYFYGFMNLAYNAMSQFCFMMMCLSILKWEYPSFNNGPSMESPRLVYQMIFNERRSGLPEIWSLFYPVEGRGYFTDREMSRIFPQNL